MPSYKLSSAFYDIIPNESKFRNIKVKKHYKLTFIYIAHSVWLKGISYLLEAWKNIESSNVQLLIAGKINPDVNDYIKSNFNNLKHVSYVGHLKTLMNFIEKLMFLSLQVY